MRKRPTPAEIDAAELAIIRAELRRAGLMPPEPVPLTAHVSLSGTLAHQPPVPPLARRRRADTSRFILGHLLPTLLVLGLVAATAGLSAQ